MIISKTKLLTTSILFSTFIASAAFAAPSEVKFNDCQAKIMEANKQKSVTWWAWLTNNQSSQFHFFQLMELLHGDDDAADTSARVDHEEDKNEVRNV
ncbi:MAG: hypothetical protein HWE10_09600 [Gammaproteobacteria bacterium]|nr:hypothetical protein [Gammaproteobacteria bacterium]